MPVTIAYMKISYGKVTEKELKLIIKFDVYFRNIKVITNTNGLFANQSARHEHHLLLTRKKSINCASGFGIIHATF